MDKVSSGRRRSTMSILKIKISERRRSRSNESIVVMSAPYMALSFLGHKFNFLIPILKMFTLRKSTTDRSQFQVMPAKFRHIQLDIPPYMVYEKYSSR